MSELLSLCFGTYSILIEVLSLTAKEKRQDLNVRCLYFIFNNKWILNLIAHLHNSRMCSSSEISKYKASSLQHMQALSNMCDLTIFSKVILIKCSPVERLQRVTSCENP